MSSFVCCSSALSFITDATASESSGDTDMVGIMCVLFQLYCLLRAACIGLHTTYFINFLQCALLRRFFIIKRKGDVSYHQLLDFTDACNTYIIPMCSILVC